MIKFAMACFGLTLLLGSAANASPVYTYDLTLTPGAGSTVGGTGTFEITSMPSATTTSTFSGSSLIDLSINIGGDDFTLADDPAAAVTFTKGVLTNIKYAYTFSGPNNQTHGDTLDLSGVYAFYYNNNLGASYGSFTAVDPPAAVPEPFTLSLLGAGLAGAVTLRRAKRAAKGLGAQ
ncbi:MAG TPA: PEP-CTERM sorting domain-containing protein [Rhizomicrobium sp.]